jgi:rRNA small subunit pseudouridine methyltransferase Nep1
MSAAAPVFNPSRPLPGSSTAAQDNKDVEMDGEANGESSTSSVMAAAIANSRVTRPLPNSRRPGVTGNMAPVQASVPKSAEEKENTRRLIVVLSQVGSSSRSCCMPPEALGSSREEARWKHQGCGSVVPEVQR